MLHCPATLLLARHGAADYGPAAVVSDHGGRLTDEGRAQVRALAGALADRRVARVYSSTMTRAVESAQEAAAVLGVDAVVLPGLEEFHAGALTGRAFDDPAVGAVVDAWLAGDLEVAEPAGESGTAVVERVGAALQEVADLHRGETVLVFSHGGALSLAVPNLADNLRGDHADGRPLPNAVPITLEIGDDGWQVTSWPAPPADAPGS